MKKKRPNRMIKTEEETVQRADDAAEPVAAEEPAEGQHVESKPAGYPCKFCQSRETGVVNVYPPYKTIQEPVKTVKRRRRKCRSCGRVFLTQEEIERLLESSKYEPRDHALLVTLYYSQLRRYQ